MGDRDWLVVPEAVIVLEAVVEKDALEENVGKLENDRERERESEGLKEPVVEREELEETVGKTLAVTDALGVDVSDGVTDSELIAGATRHVKQPSE